MSVENVSSRPSFLHGQKASDYEQLRPVPPQDKMYVSDRTAEEIDSSQQGLEFLFSPLLEEYYNPTHGHTEDNNNDQAPNASFQEDEFINPFKYTVQEIGDLPHTNFDKTDVHFIQPQSHDYQGWNQRSFIGQKVRGTPTMPVQTRRQLAKDPEMCMLRKLDESFPPVASLGVVRNFRGLRSTQVLFQSIIMDVKTALSYCPLKDEVILLSQEGFVDLDQPDKVYLLRKALYGIKASFQRPENEKILTAFSTAYHEEVGMHWNTEKHFWRIQFLGENLVSLDVKETKLASAMSFSRGRVRAIILSSVLKVMWDEDSASKKYKGK
ncbi:retrovirus-related pol polyprotein from transposon TNT 1-94 [Tanacetum coccineum]